MAWFTLSNLRAIQTTETDADSPGSEELMSQIRENIECLLILTHYTGDSGTVTGISTATLTDGAQSWDTDEHNGRTLLITSGSAIGNLYTIDDTTGTTLVCTGDDLEADGVAVDDTFMVFYDVLTNAEGHTHDDINSAPVEAPRGRNIILSQDNATTYSVTGITYATSAFWPVYIPSNPDELGWGFWLNHSASNTAYAQLRITDTDSNVVTTAEQSTVGAVSTFKSGSTDISTLVTGWGTIELRQKSSAGGEDSEVKGIALHYNA